jgi:hypothetical protein
VASEGAPSTAATSATPFSMIGIGLDVWIGKEIELFETVRDYAHHMRAAIERTPSANELEEANHLEARKDQE